MLNVVKRFDRGYKPRPACQQMKRTDEQMKRTDEQMKRTDEQMKRIDE